MRRVLKLHCFLFASVAQPGTAAVSNNWLRAVDTQGAFRSLCELNSTRKTQLERTAVFGLPGSNPGAGVKLWVQRPEPFLGYKINKQC